MNDEKKSPASIFDEGSSYSSIRRKKYKRPSASSKPRKGPRCVACGGGHPTSKCGLGR